MISVGYIYNLLFMFVVKIVVTTMKGIMSVIAMYLFNLASATLKGVLNVEIRSWHKHILEIKEAS